VALLGGFYTFEQSVLGAHYSVGAMLPYVWLTVEGKIDTALGTFERRDTAAGLGDLALIPAMLGWKRWPIQYNAAVSGYAPIGEYEAGELANPGLNYWTVNPWVGVSYNNPKNGFSAALHGGIACNTETPDTDYRSGAMTRAISFEPRQTPRPRGGKCRHRDGRAHPPNSTVTAEENITDESSTSAGRPDPGRRHRLYANRRPRHQAGGWHRLARLDSNGTRRLPCRHLQHDLGR
jgi:hypothetical protein